MLISVQALYLWLRGLVTAVEGVTVTGGEPLEQMGAVLYLLSALRATTPLSVVMFTGYTWLEAQRLAERECATRQAVSSPAPLAPPAHSLLQYTDVLITGRYQHARRLARGLRGSANKEIHCLTDRYTPADFDEVPPSEIIISPSGSITNTGIDPLPLKHL